MFAVGVLGLAIVKHGFKNSTGQIVNSTLTEEQGRAMVGDVTEVADGLIDTMLAMYVVFSVLSIIINVILLIGAHKVSLLNFNLQ